MSSCGRCCCFGGSESSDLEMRPTGPSAAPPAPQPQEEPKQQNSPSHHWKNAAFVFIKPHAVTDKVKELVKTGLEARGIEILTQGTIKAEVIDQKKLIDQHYYAIASKAEAKVEELNVPVDKFEKKFGLAWKDALTQGKVFNAKDGCKKLGIDADGMDKEWAKAKKAKNLIKFGGGFYCGLIEMDGQDPLYIFNGFYMAMRSKFTAPGTSIYYYSVAWDPAKLSWADFRGKVLGPTDPTEAPKESLRGQVLAKWEELGLKSVPNVGDNAVHASASPFEALAERCNWLEGQIKTDVFGSMMVSRGVPEETIKEWSLDPQVKLDSGELGSVFDALEDEDAEACLEKIVELRKSNSTPVA